MPHNNSMRLHLAAGDAHLPVLLVNLSLIDGMGKVHSLGYELYLKHFQRQWHRCRPGSRYEEHSSCRDAIISFWTGVDDCSVVECPWDCSRQLYYAEPQRLWHNDQAINTLTEAKDRIISPRTLDAGLPFISSFLDVPIESELYSEQSTTPTRRSTGQDRMR